MPTSSSSVDEPVRRRHPLRWRRPGRARLAASVVVGLLIGIAGLAWLAAHRKTDPVLTLVDPTAFGPVAAVRVVLLAVTALVAGIGLVSGLLGLPGLSAAAWGAVPGSARRVVWAGGAVAAAACLVAVLTGQASGPLGAAQLALCLLVPLSLGSVRAVGPVGLALAGPLAGLLAVELGTARTGLPFALDLGYALAGAVLVGASVLRVAGPDARLRRIAVPAGLLTCLTGLAQLVLTGPATGYDALRTGYGLAALAQAGLPVLATAAWLLPDRPGFARELPLSSRGATGMGVRERHRLAAGAVVLAVAAAAVLATLPRPPAAPVPGQPLLRAVELPARRLAVLVLPMRPGPNLVHIGGEPAAAQPGLLSHHHGLSPTGPPGTITVSAGDAAPVPVTARPGAGGGWAVLDIPAGTDRLTITADGTPATVPIDVGTTPAAEAEATEQRLLAGPDGPEYASAVLGGLLAAGGRPAGAGPNSCPGFAVTGLDASEAAALRDTVTFLAGRGIPALTLATEPTARASDAAEVVRAEAARWHLPITDAPTANSTLLVLTGWAGAVDGLRAATVRAASQPDGGIVLAPWLLTPGVLGAAAAEVLPLRFNPQDADARRYAATVAAVFPGDTPSAAGYRCWSLAEGRPWDERPTFYGAAPVDVPMGMAHDDATPAVAGAGTGARPGGHGEMADSASWYPGGTVVPISPPVGDPAPAPDHSSDSTNRRSDVRTQ